MTSPEKIARTFRDVATEERLEQNWRAISLHRGARRARRRFLVVALGGVILLSAITAAFVLNNSTPSNIETTLRTRSGEPLLFGIGPTFLSDGSTVYLQSGRLDVVRNTGDRIELLLRSGRARFDVRPEGPRTWWIHAGPMTVEVVGTDFSVHRDEGETSVFVHEGVVLVRSAFLDNPVERLARGGQLRVETQRGASAPEPEQADSSNSSGDHENLQTRRLPEIECNNDRHVQKAMAIEHSARRNWGQKRLAQQDDREKLPDEESPSEDIEALLEAADRAREAGNAHKAVSLLERVVQGCRDHRAALAAFNIGRLERRGLSHPNRAATAYQRALSLGLREPWAEDALALRIEALSASGQRTASIRISEDYRRLYPEGRWLEQVNRWVGEARD